MKLWKRRSGYSYYDSYGSSRRRLRVGRVFLVGLTAFLLILGLLVYLNLTRIKLMWKGYSFGETSEILSLTSEDEQKVLSFDKLDAIEDWLKTSKEVSNYEYYEKYLELHPKMKKSEIVTYIDSVYKDAIPKLQGLGYNDTSIWDLLKTASQEDLNYLVDNGYTAKDIEEYRKVKGYKIQNTHLYIEAYKEYKDYSYTVNIVNYPFILSTNETTVGYEITNPNALLTLVKKGFFLPKEYEPKDLTIPNIPIAPDCEDPQMTKDTAKALEEMAEVAKKENYHLVLKSAYRSYTNQEVVYADFEKRYGGLYASEYVATPGASEHQTGLGVDLTAQSVVDGKVLVFGDTAEYKWVIEHAHEYGFIVRFPDAKAAQTGIAHEPWHLRYVGKDVAKEIHDKGWIFEEYCLYNNVIPKVKER